MKESESTDEAAEEAREAFERAIGVTNVPVERVQIGTREFLKFLLGRDCPLYTYALLECQRGMAPDNTFRGAVGISIAKAENFVASIEANAFLTLLTRSTKEVSQGESSKGYSVPYAPFQKREDHQLAQPATHIVRGRRGVGKSTLIKRATDLLAQTPSLVAVLDMQTYSTLNGDNLIREVMYDAAGGLISAALRIAKSQSLSLDVAPLQSVRDALSNEDLSLDRAPAVMKRALSQLTAVTGGNAFLFLDDYHLIDREFQPVLLHHLNAAVKGANGWLKVAGLSSLLNVYSPKTRKGLQVPGDAQYISLDLTLENPEAAELHLKAILSGFMKAVGYPASSSAIPDSVFRRLAWANAGVPRDFLQMFGRSLEHAQRNRHSSITLSDVNVAIGEFGQQKMDDLQRDTRNDTGELKQMLGLLERLCLEQNKINAFLVRSNDSKERSLVQILSDLRMVHLIHQSITPDRAGERYEAFILDYSLFTGFRRRPGVKEMIPHALQFKAAELRALPKIAAGSFAAEATADEY